MKKIILLVIVCITFSNSFLYSQEKATTENGKEVLLNDDGTWSYIIEKENESLTR